MGPRFRGGDAGQAANRARARHPRVRANPWGEVSEAFSHFDI